MRTMSPEKYVPACTRNNVRDVGEKFMDLKEKGWGCKGILEWCGWRWERKRERKSESDVRVRELEDEWRCRRGRVEDVCGGWRGN